MNQGTRLVSLEELSRLIANNGLDVGPAVEVLGVVRSVDGNLDTVVLANSLGLLKEALGSGRRTADSDGHGADSADVSVAGSGNASRLVESVRRAIMCYKYFGVFVPARRSLRREEIGRPVALSKRDFFTSDLPECRLPRLSNLPGATPSTSLAKA